MSSHLKYGFILCALLLTTSLFGQLNRANRHFDKGEYSRAARLYEKVLDRDSTSRIAVNNLAHCYRLEKRYDEARRLFRQSLSFSTMASSNYYHYAEMHFLMGDFTAAQQVLEEFLSHNRDDSSAVQLMEHIAVVSAFTDSTTFELVRLRGVNSPYADFAPVVHNAGIVYTTERKSDAGNEEFAIEDRPFTNIYYAPFSNQQKSSFWTPKPFHKKLTSRFHDGPACFDSTGTTIYFTKVNREFTGANRMNPMRIYVAAFSDAEWSKPEALPFNSDAYSVAHPALGADNKTLIFASDMPGGRGGMDLYLTRKQGDGWSEPINLGPMVNSPGDEVFPHLQQGALYFSSNGWPGYGGLDLFVSHLDSLDQPAQNLYRPINSAWDDLSISYLNEHQAYFSSDRPGGMGRDDIYGLRQIADGKTHRELSGVLEYDNKPAAFESLLLKDQLGNILQRTETNDQGRFSLDFLKSRVPYTLSLGNEARAQLERYAIYFLNDREQKVQKITPSEAGDFRFELLPPDDFDDLELLDVEDVSLLSLDIRGQVYEESLGDYDGRVEVLVLNAAGDVVGRTYTRNNGAFLFKHLFPDDQYVFRLLADNPALKIAILDDQGNVIEELSRSGREFIFNRIGEGDPILSLLNESNVTIKISPDDKFAIPNIYYDLDAYALNDAARRQLDKLVTILKKNPGIGVNVMSHTDARASDLYNLRLSEQRAGEVVRYLTASGVDGERITGKGFGEKRLVNDCDNNADCTEDEHARNRRTEFSLQKL